MVGVLDRVKKRKRRMWGQEHPRAVLSDHEVELLLALREEGYSLAWLARKFEMSKGGVWKIVAGLRRGRTW